MSFIILCLLNSNNNACMYITNERIDWNVNNITVELGYLLL